MLPSHLHQWTIVITGLKLSAYAMENALSRLPERVVEDEYSAFFNDSAKNGLELIAALCDQINLDGARDEALHLISRMNQPINIKRLAASLEHLFQRIQADTKAVALLHVPPEDRELYERGSDIFSAVARRKFRSAEPDMAEAAKCLALGRYTGSVFHSMRAAEAGVRKLAQKVGIELAPKWGWAEIVDRASTKIKELPGNTAAEARRKSALASACSHAHMLRIAYRNQVMHPNARYDRPQAVQVLDGTRGFLDDLALGM